MTFDNDKLISEELMAPERHHDESQNDTTGAPLARPTNTGAPLSPIPEADEEMQALSFEEVDLQLHEFLIDATDVEPDIPPYPILCMPNSTVMITEAGGEEIAHEWYPDDLSSQYSTSMLCTLLADDSEHAHLTHDLPCTSSDTKAMYRKMLQADPQDYDDQGAYIELLFSKDMAHLADVDTYMPDDHSATIRVYSTVEAKRAVVVKDDDLLQRWEVVICQRGFFSYGEGTENLVRQPLF